MIRDKLKLKSIQEVSEIFHNLLFKYIDVTKEPLFYVCGGALRDTFLNESFNDIDIYTTNVVSEEITKSFFTSEGVLDSEKAHVYNFTFNGLKIQLIKNTFSNKMVDKLESVICNLSHLSKIQKVLATFDFTVNCVALGTNINNIDNFKSIYGSGGTNFINNYLSIDLSCKLLVPTAFSLQKPINIINRAMKFSKRGYTFTVNDINNLLIQVNNMDLKENPSKLMESYYDEFKDLEKEL
jgi:hypothetical protein